MNWCAAQVQLFTQMVPQLTREIGADPAIAVAEELNWKFEGCRAHQATVEFPNGVPPCGNKGERGIFQGASCASCPHAGEIDALITVL